MFRKILNQFSSKNNERKSVSLFEEIQNDILGNLDLSQILRRSQVLAYKLKNKEFKDWVENELNGYNDGDLLPEYRKLSVVSQATYWNGHWRIDNQLVPLTAIPDEFIPYFNECSMFQGIKELESLLETLKRSNQESLRISIPSELYSFLSYTVYDNLQCVGAWRLISNGQVTQIIETTRNRLLEFILKLADKYPEIKGIRSNTDLINEIPSEQIKRVFNISILGWKNQVIGSTEKTLQGEIMSVFDQRGQTVNTQYNAAGDINFNSVHNSSEFIAELRKLKDEFSRIAKEEAIDAEIVTDTEYQLTKAIQQAEKPNPNKENILTHLENAKQLVDGVDTAIKVGGWITVAIELAHKIFG